MSRLRSTQTDGGYVFHKTAKDRTMTKLWRLTRAPFIAFDGSGPAQHGARWTSPGLPVVNFASEPGLAVLVVLRYLPRDLAGIDQDYLLGWTETEAVPERLPYDSDPIIKRQRGDDWLTSGRSLFAAVTSAVLPETDIIMMNPRHPDAAHIPPLTTRPFSFTDCLSLPPYDAATTPLQ
jgi:RES domain-containing protein